MSAHLPTQPPTPPAPATAAVETSKPAAAKTEEKKPVVSKVEPLKAIAENGVAAHPAVPAAKDFFPAGPGASRPADEFRNLPLDQVVPSATNPRKHFAGQELEELVASIRRSGVLVPILVRPRTATLGDYERASAILRRIDSKVPKVGEPIFEIVAGERRYRAALKAGLEEIPARVKEMNDEQALEAQIVENLQRKDVAPIEEAHGYAVLLAQMAKGSKGEKAPSRQQLVEQLAQRLGKSVRYVYARMKLTELVPEAQALLEQNEITASHADELVRLQPADQKKAIKELLYEERYDRRSDKNIKDVASYRSFKAAIAREFHLSLDGAAWKKDDAQLVPKAGACTVCPKSTANQPLLYPDEKHPQCTDRECFAAKREAFVKIQLAAAGDGKGKDVLKLLAGNVWPQPKEAIDYWKWTTRRVAKNSCGKAQPGVVVAGDAKDAKVGETFLVCLDSKCKTHAPKHPAQRSYSTSLSPKERQKEKERLEREKLEKGTKSSADAAVLQAIFGKVNKKLGKDEVELIADQVIQVASDVVELDDENAPIAKAICEFVGMPVPKGPLTYDWMPKLARKSNLSVDQFGRLMIALSIASYLDYPQYSALAGKQVSFDEIAKRYKVDAKPIRAKVVDAAKAKTEKKTAPPAQTATKNKLGPEDRKKIAAGLRERWAAKKKGGRK